MLRKPETYSTQQVMQPKTSGSNPTKPKLYANEIGHLGSINATAVQRSTTMALHQRHQMTDGPHNPVNKPPLLSPSLQRPPSVPPTEKNRLLTEEAVTEQTLAKDMKPKRNLSIKTDMSPKQNPAKLAQLKSLSTRHSDIEHSTSEQAKVPPLMLASNVIIPNHDPAKCSVKKNGVVRAYAANTNQGLVR